MARTTTPNEDHGKPIDFDPTFKGPLRNRSCTDIICLLIFVVFLAAWFGIGLYAWTNGDPDTLLVPKDSQGSRCGFDAHVKNKKYLLFFDLTKCLDPSVPFTGCPTTQICVEKCPEKEFLYKTSTNFRDMYCVDGQAKPTNMREAEALVNDNKCAKWALPSTPVLNRCIYNIADRKRLEITNVKGDEIAKMQKYLSVSKTWLSLVTQSGISVFTDKDYPHQVGHDIVEDIENCWVEILGGLLIGIAVCIIYIAMLRWVAAVMVWLSIFGTIAILSFCTYLSAMQYMYYKDHPKAYLDNTNVFDKILKKNEFWLVILIILAIVLLILLIVIVFLRKRIVLAIALIKEGSKAVSSVTSSLFFPIIPWILQILIIISSITIALYLSTLGNPYYVVKNFDENYCQCSGAAANYKNDIECSVQVFQDNCKNISSTCEAACQFVNMDNPKIVPFLQAFNIFGFFWAVFFISAMGEMILASTFATWYWTFNKSDVPFFAITTATARTLRYHMGTLAFGSLIVAICRMIRVCLEYIDHKLKKYDNPLTKALMCCLKCFFYCLEKFIKFINKNAYIMCAIHGKNFCSSAKDAFSLLLRNIVRVFVLDKVTDFLFFLSKLLVTIGVSCIAYAFIEYASEKRLNYVFVPVVFVAVCTYFVATVFFSVYTMAVDTLFLCFLEDSERNDGSANKPYFMSHNLMKILGKKNKRE